MKRNQKVQADRVQKEKFTRTQFPVLLPMNDHQKEMIEAMKYNTIIVAQGSAGVGKTMLGIHHAARKLFYGDIKKVVLLRAYQPLVGRTIGFMPGDALAKLMPYYQQMVDYFEDFLGKASTEIHIKNGSIEICSLETIRGRSWSDCIIIVDEAQNLNENQMMLVISRLCTGSKMIIVGDKNQTDIPEKSSGFKTFGEILQGIEGVGFFSFTVDDIMREPILIEISKKYEEWKFSNQKEKDSKRENGSWNRREKWQSVDKVDIPAGSYGIITD